MPNSSDRDLSSASLRAKRSNPSSCRGRHGLLRYARKDGILSSLKIGRRTVPRVVKVGTGYDHCDLVLALIRDSVPACDPAFAVLALTCSGRSFENSIVEKSRQGSSRYYSNATVSMPFTSWRRARSWPNGRSSSLGFRSIQKMASIHARCAVIHGIPAREEKRLVRGGRFEEANLFLGLRWSS
jgi:hypothetical protein